MNRNAAKSAAKLWEAYRAALGAGRRFEVAFSAAEFCKRAAYDAQNVRFTSSIAWRGIVPKFHFFSALPLRSLRLRGE